MDLQDPGGSSRYQFTIESVYERYRPQVFRFLVSKGLQVDTAEDLSQEVFFRLLRSKKPLVDEEYTRNLIFRIAQNLLIDTFRKTGGAVTEAPGLEEVPDERSETNSRAGTPEDIYISTETSSDVLSVLSSMPERHAEAIVLREFEGLSYKEMAGRLGISEKAAESLLHRARTQLKSDLVEAGKRRGGWWSLFPVYLGGAWQAVRRIGTSTVKSTARKAVGLAEGVSAAAVAHTAVAVMVALLVAGSLVFVGVTAATSPSRSNSTSTVTAPVAQQPAASQQGAGLSVASFLPPITRPAAVAASSAKTPAESALAPLQDGVKGVLVWTGGTVSGLLQSGGATVDKLLSVVGGIVQKVVDPTLSILREVGVPEGMLSGIQYVSSMGLTRDLAAGLVQAGVNGTQGAFNNGQPPAAGQPAVTAAGQAGDQATQGAQAPAATSGDTTSTQPSNPSGPSVPPALTPAPAPTVQPQPTTPLAPVTETVDQVVQGLLDTLHL